jgi:hypothetical protein
VSRWEPFGKDALWNAISFLGKGKLLRDGFAQKVLFLSVTTSRVPLGNENSPLLHVRINHLAAWR